MVLPKVLVLLERVEVHVNLRTVDFIDYTILTMEEHGRDLGTSWQNLIELIAQRLQMHGTLFTLISESFSQVLTASLKFFQQI